jgi:hypothetical protein
MNMPPKMNMNMNRNMNNIPNMREEFGFGGPLPPFQDPRMNFNMGMPNMSNMPNIPMQKNQNNNFNSNMNRNMQPPTMNINLQVVKNNINLNNIMLNQPNNNLVGTNIPLTNTNRIIKDSSSKSNSTTNLGNVSINKGKQQKKMSNNDLFNMNMNNMNNMSNMSNMNNMNNPTSDSMFNSNMFFDMNNPFSQQYNSNPTTKKNKK